MMPDDVQTQRSALLGAHDQSLNVAPMRREIIPTAYSQDVQPCKSQSNLYEVKHQSLSLSLPKAVSSGHSNVCFFNDNLGKLLNHSSYMQSKSNALQLNVNMRHLVSKHRHQKLACMFSFATLLFL